MGMLVQLWRDAAIRSACLKRLISAILRCCDFQPRGHFCPGISRCPAGVPVGRRPGASVQAMRDSQDRNRASEFERNSISVVMIRLARVGAPKQPYYRVVVIEKDRARNGRSIEVVGTYNPRTSPASVDLKHDRIAYWRGVGAQFTPIVAKLVEKNPAKAAEPAVA